jgi:RND family efflux transporter MFP subunit
MKHNLLSDSVSNALVQRAPAPLAGLIIVMTLAAALAAWTVRRIAAAEAAQERPEPANTKSGAPATARAHLAAPDVSLVRPIKAVWSPQFDIEGTLAPEQVVDLAFPLSGKLAWSRVKIGDQVTAGARLAGLETSQADGQLAATEARMRATAAQLALANDNAVRAHALLESGSHSPAAAVQSALQKQVALAELDAARAQIALAQASLSDHTLRAPFAGTVVQAPEGIGGVVSSGQAVIRLADLSKLKLDATVSEADATLLRVGAKMVIVAEQGRIEGRISSVLTALDERTRRVPIQGEFDRPAALRAGSLVRATIEAQQATDVLRIPRDALRPGSQNEIVVLVPGSPATLAVRPIDYVADASGDMLVRSGLSAEDAVVMRPGPDAKSGDLVSITGRR